MNSVSNNVSLQAHGLVKSYQSGRVRTDVLTELSISVAEQQLTLISGPSGCGKSTLLAVLSGLLQPDHGQVTALGMDLRRLDVHAMNRFRLRHTGFIFQGFSLFPALTALEQVELPLLYLGVRREDARNRANSALADVGLAHRADLRPVELSGGEKQRVAIARAMAKQPRLLFADEPTSNLDATNGLVVIEILHRIARVPGTAVLCVSHDPRLIAHADRVLTMEDGKIQSDQVGVTAAHPTTSCEGDAG